MDSPPVASSLSSPAKSRWILIAAISSAVVVFLLPLIAIRSVAPSGVSIAEVGGASAATAALGALFRSGARHIVRGTLVTALRTTSRAASRRVLRRATPLLVRVFVPRDSDAAARPSQTVPHLLAGAAGLSASLAAVLWLAPSGVTAAVLQGVPAWTAALIAGALLIVHYAILLVACRGTGASLGASVPIDGILIQLYFTGAGSFLPILADIELRGTTKQRGRAALALLITLTCLQLALSLVGSAISSPVISLAGAMVAVYAFVTAFPLEPLDGWDLWDYSPALWLMTWLAVATSFLIWLPEAWYGII